MIGVTAENHLPAWQSLQITEVTAEDWLPIWQALQITGVTGEN